MMLSILVPTTPERRDIFERLVCRLIIQREYCTQVHPTLGEAEIIWDDSRKFLDGGLSIGKKREMLIWLAKGKYCCFVDDDDMVSPDYVETLLRLCNRDKDICTFNAIGKLKDYWSVYQMMLGNPNEESRPGIVRRSPWHICPVRTSTAHKYDFEDINYGEDWKWFTQVLSDCKTQAHSEHILYEYRHGDHSSADEIVRHQNKIICTPNQVKSKQS